MGVSNAGVIAAQAGDFTLRSDGRVLLTGRTTASGNVALNSNTGITNTGTAYARGSLAAHSAGDLTNSGTLAAQGALNAGAGSVNSTGSLAAGVNGDGVVTQAANLNVDSSGALSATGHNVAGGDATLSGVSVNLAGSETAANGNLSLTANAGDLNLSGATTSAQGAVNAQASGAMVNDHGAMTGGAVTLNAGRLSNQGGNVSAQGPLNATAAGDVSNQAGVFVSQGAMQVRSGGAVANGQGTMQSAMGFSLSGTSLDNTAGRITSLNGDGLNLGVTGTLLNGVGGVIGGNGNVQISAYTFRNAGQVSALHNAILNAWNLSNSGSASAGDALTATATGLLANAGGTLSGTTVTATGASIDNAKGNIDADTVAVSTPGDLNNEGGVITQTGSSAQTASVGGRLDNSNGGRIASNATNLRVTGASIDNGAGAIAHAGTGTLTVSAGNGAGAVSNAGGAITSNGNVVAQAGSLNNTAGSVSGQRGVAATVSGALDNTGGKVLSNTDLSVTSATLTNDGGQIGAGANGTIRIGSMTNSGGKVVAPNLTISTADTLDNSGGDIESNRLALSATDLLNHGGTITQYDAVPMGLHISGTFDNSSGGTLQTSSTDFSLTPWALNNNGGSILHAGAGTFTIAPGNGAGALSNVGGRIITAGELVANAGSVDNTSGVFAAQGYLSAAIAGVLNNTQGVVRSLASASIDSGALTNVNGQIQSGTGAAGDVSTLAVRAASTDNTRGVIGNLGRGDTTVQGGSELLNAGGQVTGNGNLDVNASSILNTQGAQVSGANVTVTGDNLNNTSGAIGNVAGLTGDVTVTTTGAIDNTRGQIGATHDLAVRASTLTGGGAYSAANDVAISMQGDFATAVDVQFNAGHDLTFTLPGAFANAALVEAGNNLGINAGDIFNSGTMMAGGTLTTHSGTLQNTGTMVGGSVSLYANRSLTNVGPAALIGATDSNGTLELLANDIENRDDTTATDTQATTAIYGLGKVVLAGGKDANGHYTNAALIRNQSALVESAGDMELHADQVTNTRRVMTTTGLNQPVDPALLEQLGISLSGCVATYMAACGPGNPQVLGSKGDPTMIGGVPTDPPHGGQWNSTYQYTTYTGVAVANLIAGISPQAQIIAGGTLDASSVGLFQNYWSAVAAVANIAAPVSLDQNSWRVQAAPGVQVTYSGQYHYDNYDNSEHNWQLPFGDAGFVTNHPGGYTQAAPADIRNYALPAYESSFVAGGTLSGSGIHIDNTAGNAGIPSLGLAAGQSLTGVDVGAVSGNAGGTKGGTASVKGGGSRVDPVIASATAQNVLQNLTIPQGGLFRPVSTPGVNYLIETNPAFTNQKAFISSDYYLQQLGLNPQTTEKRLGDGFYEQQLVRNQMTSLTGKAVLGPYTDLQSMYEAMLAAGASLSKSLDLPLGMSLSPEQVAQLTSNVIIMQTQVVDGQSVLVPVVYLAKASQQNMDGPLIAATDIDLKNAQTFTNSGTVQAANSMQIDGQSINNAFGALTSGGLMALATAGNVDLTSAKVNAGSLVLNAGGNVILDAATKTLNQVSATGATRVSTTTGPVASLNVAGDAAIITGGNFEQHGANLDIGGNLGMAVGGNYDIGTVQTGEHKVVERANGVSDTNINSVTGSTVNVGGVSVIGVGGDLTASGANLNLGGGGTIAAKGDVTLDAAKATSTIDSNSSGSDGHGSYSESSHRSHDALTATTLNAGDSLAVVSGKNIDINGSSVNLDKGTLALAATGDVNIGAATETHIDSSQEQHSHSNVVSGKEVASSHDTTVTRSQGSTISADSVSISGGHDISVNGSTVVGTNDVALAAAHDVNIGTTQDTMQSSGSYAEKRTGLGTSGLTVTVGSSKLAKTDQQSSVTNNASTVGSINGNLAIQAGNTLHVTGSDLLAGGNVTGMASNIIIDSATDTAHQARTQKTSSSGVTIGLAGSVGDAINNAYSEGRAVSHSADSGNDRAAALHAIAAGSDAAMAGAGVKALADGGKPDIGIKVSIGSSKSQSQSSEDMTTQRGSNVAAGAAAAFVATGDGTPGSGNVTIAGSNVSANDVLLAAKNQVDVVNTTNTDSTRSSNSSSSASIGVQYTLGGGFGVSAAMANAHGDANSDAAVQNASHVNGTNSVTVISGSDTNITGSQVHGGKVIADVGGNLNIASVQDVTNSAAHQSSAGGGFTISQGGGSASFSAQNGHADSNYAGVKEQAGINADSGGFDINVRGNADLKGGVITSAADAAQNSLTTGTLTYGDIANQSHYSANSSGISVGGGLDSTGKAIGPGSTPGGAIPTFASQAGDESATTRSAIGAGTITITDATNQTQDVASLSRDTTGTNGMVSKTPDVNEILNQQADTMQAARAAGQVIAQGIGTYAQGKYREAQDQADAATKAGNLELAAQYQAVADSWAEGGSNRVTLHIGGGALLGGLGGGSVGTALQGAAGAGLSAALANQLDSLSKGIADSTGSTLLGSLASNVAAGVGGALVGGGAGATTAANADLYNRQLHPDERKLAKNIADKSNGQYTQAQVEDQLRLMGLSSADGSSVPPGTAEELNGRTPTDPGAKWIDTGLTNANGNPLVIQALPQANPELQAFILQNYNSATPGGVPSVYTYTPTPVATDVRGAVANVAESVSTAAGRIGSAAAAGASLPTPYAPALDTIAFGSTVTGIAADFIQQIAQPNSAQYVFNGFTAMLSNYASSKFPGLTPAINELTNQVNSSSAAASIQDRTNKAVGANTTGKKQ
ncbi:hemagglutinin repeat-containing protein [Paraburkholderia sp. EG287A]|uniref:hemagglutinin repeat-containing protein n=1 Tax=Paraburkholderia sp. EG287A TaxID=3237012 RepID=UPI0034D16C50